MRPVSVTPQFIEGKKQRATLFDYPVPKWIEFCERMLTNGFEVSYYEAQTTVSKYVTIRKGSKSFLVRFSNHKPNRQREIAKDCDFFVGVTHLGVTRTEDAIRAVQEHFS